MSVTLHGIEDPLYSEYKSFQAFQALVKTAPTGAPQFLPTAGPAFGAPIGSFGLASQSPIGLVQPQLQQVPILGSQQQFGGYGQNYINNGFDQGYVSRQFQQIGNPAPVGLFAFALTLFVFSMHNAGASVNTTTPAGVLLGLALFYGGIIQFSAGMWELRVGNTFGGAVFASYGGFWLSYAVLYIPLFGIATGYVNGMNTQSAATFDPTTVNRSFGIYYFAWTIFTLLIFIASHRTTVVLALFFFTLFVKFLLLTIGYWSNMSVFCIQAAGAFGLLSSAFCWYAATASLLTRENSVFLLPVGDLNQRYAHLAPSVKLV